MIVEISPRKFELLSRTTGRVLGTHPSYQAALRQERAIKASQARAAARTARRNPSKKGFHELQDAWRRAYSAQLDLRITLERKYQRTTWASKGELTKLDKLSRAADRASDAFYRWLEQNSPWDFTSGVNTAWVRDKLTESQALGSEPPTLPAAATSYGYEAKEFRPVRRNPSARDREPGETAGQQAVRNWTVPALAAGAVVLIWLVSRPSAASTTSTAATPYLFTLPAGFTQRGVAILDSNGNVVANVDRNGFLSDPLTGMQMAHTDSAGVPHPVQLAPVPQSQITPIQAQY